MSILPNYTGPSVISQSPSMPENLYKPVFSGLNPYDLASIGRGLLQSSKKGESTGSGLLSGMDSFLAGRQQQMQDERNRQLELERLAQLKERAEQQRLRTQTQRQQLESQQERQRKLAGLAERLGSGELDREAAQLEYAGITGDYSKVLGGDIASPANVREYEYFAGLPKEEQSRYLQVKRANQMFDRGATQAFVDPQGQIVSEYEKTLAPEQLPQTKFEQAQQSALGKAAADKLAGLSGIESKADQMLATINNLITPEGTLREGVDTIVGGPLGIQGAQSAIRPLSESQRKFQPYINQLKGQAFLQAYQDLKGGGHITEIEGEKAEQAIVRLSQTQSEKDFANALKDLRDVTAAGARRAKLEQKRLSPTQAPETEEQRRRKVSFDSLR